MKDRMFAFLFKKALVSTIVFIIITICIVAIGFSIVEKTTIQSSNSTNIDNVITTVISDKITIRGWHTIAVSYLTISTSPYIPGISKGLYIFTIILFTLSLMHMLYSFFLVVILYIKPSFIKPQIIKKYDLINNLLLLLFLLLIIIGEVELFKKNYGEYISNSTTTINYYLGWEFYVSTIGQILFIGGGFCYNLYVNKDLVKPNKD